jgi:membrane fusion protein, multidrug efflux system
MSKPVSNAGAGEAQSTSTYAVALVVIGLLAAAGIGYAVWIRPKAPQSLVAAGGPPPASVSTTKAAAGSVGVYVNGLGSVTPLATVSVRSRVDGEVMSVKYTEGQLVQKGAPLVEIDSRPYLAQLTQAQGQLERDRALLENARLDLERYKDAFAQNAIPRQQLDTQKATVHQFEGVVKLDEGLVETANVQLAYCSIAAPISGRIGLRMIDPGNVVHANDSNPLVIITQLQPITVTFGVAENNLPEILARVRAGKALAVEAYDHEGVKKLAEGTLLTLDNQVDPGSGTVKFKALFPNEDESLFPNQFVNARLLVDTEKGVVVPAGVVQRNSQGPFVYLVDHSPPEGTNPVVALTPVVVGASDAGLSVVRGLKPGDEVVADNFNRLQDHGKIVIRPASEGGNRGGRGGGRGGAAGAGENGGRGGRGRGGEPGDGRGRP